jgi:hypothetical protein
VIKVREEYFKTKYKPADIWLKVNAMTYLKDKLQFKCRNNKK